MPLVTVGSPNKLKNILTSFSDAVGFTPLQSQYVKVKFEKEFGIRVNDFELGKFVDSHDGPVLVVHDKFDKMVPVRVVEEIKQDSYGPDFLVTEGLGHNRILRDAVTIGQILEFVYKWRDSREDFEIAFRFGLI